MLRQEDGFTLSEDQDKIVEELKAYVTKPISFVSTLMAPLYSKPAEESFDLLGHIEKLDDEHQATLETFLNDRINNRHWVSPQTAMNSAVPATWFGLAVSGIAASFGGPFAIPMVLGSAGSVATDQLYHQHTIKQRAPLVLEALKLVRSKQMSSHPETVDLLGELKAPSTPAPQSFGSSLLGMFSQPQPVNDSAPTLRINTPEPQPGKKI